MKYYTVSITTGDIDGIGTEVTVKALSQMGPDPKIRYILCRSTHCPNGHLNILKEKFNLISVSHWDEVFDKENLPANYLIDLVMEPDPTRWFEDSTSLCLSKKLDGIITAPLSKTEMMKSSSPFLGHTELLKSKTANPNIFMAFVGEKFNILSVTGHIPFKDITATLNEDLLLKSLFEANQLRLSTPHLKDKPLGLLGLNPHAGENDLIGDFESRVVVPVLERARDYQIPIQGPLVPDSAFLPKYWNKYSVYICLYHDQGLIPFKMIHGQDSGAHITMGLPFVRTSVDHGTAKDLFNLNQANPNSMMDALKWAKHLLEKTNDNE